MSTRVSHREAFSPLGFFLLLFLFALSSPACKDGGGGGSALPPEGAPVAALAVSPGRGSAPLGVVYDASASSVDPARGPPSYSWDFGNGETSTEPSGVVIYRDPGTYIVRLTVTDSGGASDAARGTVEVQVSPSEESFAHRVLHLTNLERQAAGLPPLKGEASLDAAALGHAFDMAQNDYFAHQSLDGRTPWQRMAEQGYLMNTGGENIAAGHASPEAVVEAWMASPGHRQNILNPAFRELGVGYYFEANDVFPSPPGYRHYWVQDFGLRSAVLPVVIDREAFETSDTGVELYVYGAGWAVVMMVSEDAQFTGASWQPYQTVLSFTLSPEPGLKRVHVRLRSAFLEVREAYDEILLR